MPKLKYVGKAHFREISAKDFENVGVQGAESIRIGRHDLDAATAGKTPLEVEVSDEAAAWLLKNEKGDWKEVKDGEEVVPDEEPEGGSQPPIVDAPASEGAGAGETVGTATTGGRGRR